MSVPKELTNVIIFAITQLEVIFAAAVLATVFTMMTRHVIVSRVVMTLIAKLNIIISYVYTCADIDECDEDTDGCAHMCTDTKGGYVCSCDVGYRLANDSHGCDGRWP